jgi:hypothetical protein
MLEQKAKRDERVLRLQTQQEIGLLTSLAQVHCVESVSRSAGGRKVAAYVRLDLRRDEGLKRFYLRLVHRRGAQKAKLAVARKL